jgi:ABC-type multidrug transport system fused ATPase/permease subunit
MARYFEHVLHLPLSFHTRVHSGRLMKVMLEGAGGMSGLWLSFFRENCASLVALVVLLPLSLFINWRLASLLIVLVVVFGLLTSYVLRRTEALQQAVRAAQFGSRRTRLRRARQRAGDPELHPHRDRGARPQRHRRRCSTRRCRCCRGGRSPPSPPAPRRR